MEIKETKLDNSAMELEIAVPMEKVEEEYKAVFRKIQNYAKIDGFRKGKAPLAMIESRYISDADQEVAENLAKSSFLDAITEKQLTPIGRPRFDVNKIKRGESFNFKAWFETPPTVKLGKYKDISADESSVTISNDDVTSEIDALRERHAQVKKKEDGTVQKGDFIRINVKRIDNVNKADVDKVEYRDYTMIVGKSKDQYGFDSHVLNMKNEEEKEVQIKYPKDYSIKEYANQKITFLVKITEINSMDLPALDDDFAKKVNYETVSDMLLKIHEFLEKYVGERIRGDAKAQIIKEVVEHSTFDLPESLVINEMASIFQKTQQNMGFRAENLDQMAEVFGMDPEEYRNKLKDDATRSVKTTLALAEIAKVENMKVSEDKYKEVLDRIAKRNNQSIEEIEALITKNKSRENIEFELILDDAMDFIYQNAKIKKLKPVSLDEFINSSDKKAE